MSELTHDAHALGVLAHIASDVKAVLHQLRRSEEWGGTGDLVRVRWDPAGAGGYGGRDISGEFDYGATFESVGIFNLNGFSINVAFTPEAARSDATSVLTLPAYGFVILPYKGTTVSVSGAAAGSALIVPFDIPQPANAGVHGPAFGSSASGVADDGSNPIKVGGIVRAAQQSAKTAGTRTEIALNQFGEVVISGAGGLADGVAVTGLSTYNATPIGLGTVMYGFNGANSDRQRLVAKAIDIPVTAVVAGTPVTLWTPGAGKKFRLLGWALSLSVAGSVILLDNAAGAFIPGGRTPLMAAGVGLVQPPMPNGFLSAVANNVLKADVSASGNIQGFVYGTEE
jgi:hypothetical protein